MYRSILILHFIVAVSCLLAQTHYSIIFSPQEIAYIEEKEAVSPCPIAIFEVKTEDMNNFFGEIRCNKVPTPYSPNNIRFLEVLLAKGFSVSLYCLHGDGKLLILKLFGYTRKTNLFFGSALYDQNSNPEKIGIPFDRVAKSAFYLAWGNKSNTVSTIVEQPISPICLSCGHSHTYFQKEYKQETDNSSSRELSHTHQWSWCKCSTCGIINLNGNHLMNYCKCKICGLTWVSGNHLMNYCKCKICGLTWVSGKHLINYCKCEICGLTWVSGNHLMNYCKCKICGLTWASGKHLLDINRKCTVCGLQF